MGWVNDKGGSAVQKFKDGGKVDNKFQEATKEGIKKYKGAFEDKKAEGMKKWKEKFKAQGKKKPGKKVKKFEEGGKIKTNRGEGDKYKTIYPLDGPAGGRMILVEQDLDAKERRAARAKKNKARKDKAAAEAKAKSEAKAKAAHKADVKSYEEYQKTKGPNDPPYQP